MEASFVAATFNSIPSISCSLSPITLASISRLAPLPSLKPSTGNSPVIGLTTNLSAPLMFLMARTFSVACSPFKFLGGVSDMSSIMLR